MTDGERDADTAAQHASRRPDRRWWLCLVPATVFIILASALQAGIPFVFDRPISLAAHGIAGAGFDRAAWWLARIGYGLGVIPFDVLLVIVLTLRHRLRDAGFAFIALAGSLLLDAALKIAFERPRPTLWMPEEIQHTSGFPSGHAMACATLVVVVTALSWRGRWRWPILLVSAAFALIVGASRIYVGVHYPSDILAGWSAGIAWAMAMHLVVFRLPRPASSGELAS